MAKKRTPQILVEWDDPTARGGTASKALVTKEGIRVAAKMTRAGHPQHSISATIGIGREAFRKAIERQPELRQALDVSLGELEQEMVAVMVAAARAGAWQPACALLKGKFGFREHGEVKQPTGTTQINIVIPPRLSDAEYDKIIKDITPLPDTEIVEGVIVQKRITR